MSLLTEAVRFDVDLAPRSLQVPGRHGCNWPCAAELRAAAAAKRIAGDFETALADANAALQTSPRCTEARHEKGMALLDAGRATEALVAFRSVFVFNGSAPDIERWLLRAHVRARRAVVAAATAAAPSNPHGAVGRGDGGDAELGSKVGAVVHPAVRSAVNRVLKRHGVSSDPTEQAAAEAVADAAAAAVELPLAGPANDGGGDGNDRAGADATNDAAGPGTAARWESGDFLTVLGLAATPSPDAIRQQHRKLSKQFHPDRPGGSTATFSAVASAYECLSKEDCRAAHEAGDDLPKEGPAQLAVADVVRRQYAPHAFDYEAFGDPFWRERRMRAINAEARREHTAARLREFLERPLSEDDGASAGAGKTDGGHFSDEL